MKRTRHGWTIARVRRWSGGLRLTTGEVRPSTSASGMPLLLGSFCRDLRGRTRRWVTGLALAWKRFSQNQQDVGIPSTVQSQRFVDLMVASFHIDHCGVHAKEYPR